MSSFGMIMKPTHLVADYNVYDYAAGAEMVDDNIITALGIDYIRAKDFTIVNPDHVYIISNATTLPLGTKQALIAARNYIVMEHDYKIHPTRQPHRYRDNIFPKEELDWLQIQVMQNAKANLFQSNDHLECYIKNLPGTPFTSKVLDGSIWSDKELEDLKSIMYESGIMTHKWAVLGDPGPDKGAENAIQWCKANTIDFEIIPKLPKLEFYRKLAEHPVLIYIPNVKESFCRLVVEARCLLMNVVSPKTYGAVKEPWFKLSGLSMISHMADCTKKNLEVIRSLCQ